MEIKFMAKNRLTSGELCFIQKIDNKIGNNFYNQVLQFD